MKEIVLDTETTGLSVKNGHRIVEIGCIELDELVLTSNRYHYYLNPERKVSEEAFKIHGYTYEKLKNEVETTDNIQKIEPTISDEEITADNIIDDVQVEDEKIDNKAVEETDTSNKE